MARQRRALIRDRILIAMCLFAALAAGGTLGHRIATAAPPRPAAVNVAVPAESDGTSRITFVGDTMLGDGATPVIAQHGFEAVTDGVAPLLRGFTIANSETPITAHDQVANPNKSYSYATAPATADALAAAGVNALGLANNHALDRGPQGLADTRRHSDEAGMVSFGAGSDPTEAERPLLLDTPHGTIAVLAFGENYGSLVRVGKNRPGIHTITPEAVQRGIDLARAAGATMTVAYVHWGDNYTDVNDDQLRASQLFSDAGYDLVIGSGPHIAQRIEQRGGTTIVHSLGNFIFGAPGRFATFGRPGIGLIATLEVQQSHRQLVLTCIRTDNRLTGYRPQRCTPEEETATHQTLYPSARATESGAIVELS